tara:strand:- start:130 stop:801 length:672 start_codon:yes stop_codon:yes gene_type:complete
MNKELIDTRLVAKLMNQTAKECGMVRVYSCTDSIWWHKAIELEELGAIYPFNNYRRLAKCYDFLDDRFIKELAKKVKAEGFDLADCGLTAKKRKSKVRNYKCPKYKEAVKKRDALPLKERLKTKWPEPPIIPNTENAVYVRLIAHFKNKVYSAKSINSTSKETTRMGLGVLGMPSLAELVNYYIESEHYKEVTEECTFELERLETGKKVLYTYEEWKREVSNG